MNTSRFFKRYAAVVIALVAIAAGPVHAADQKGVGGENERELITLLQSDAPAAEKAITCKKLALCGTKDAVPALAPLLTDKRLNSWARIALEAIPGPEADKALREAVGKLDGRLLIGVIHSIGVRRDTAAVDLLATRLADKDGQVASAAAVVLGRIGNAPATKALRQSLSSAPTPVRTAVAEGCILSAERLLADGKSGEAAEIYDEVRHADVARPRVQEATRGAIIARGSSGIPLLVEQLRSADKGLFHIGLSAARELSSDGVIDALESEIVRAAPDRAALMLFALADRSETVLSSVVLQSAASGPKQVRIAAIAVLGRRGNASCVATLLDIGLEADAALAEPARAALGELPGKEVDAEISARLPSADGPMLQLLIELVGHRRIDAVAALLKALDHPDANIRSAALTALGTTVGPEDLAVLVERVASPKFSEDAEPARRALRAACVRMPDREACAGLLAAAIPPSSLPAKRAFLDTLGAVGGSKALETLGVAAKDANPQLQDTATRLLGEWMTVDAGPLLLELAQTPNYKYNVRALRGYIRLARQFSSSAEQRAGMCADALQAARRPAEQKLVLEVLEHYPSAETLKVAKSATEIPALKEDATRVSQAIAKKLSGKKN